MIHDVGGQDVFSGFDGLANGRETDRQPFRRQGLQPGLDLAPVGRVREVREKTLVLLEAMTRPGALEAECLDPRQHRVAMLALRIADEKRLVGLYRALRLGGLPVRRLAAAGRREQHAENETPRPEEPRRFTAGWSRSGGMRPGVRHGAPPFAVT